MPHCRARSSSPRAISGLVCSPSSAGTCVRLRRSSSATQDSGTNSRALTGQWNGVELAGSSARYSALTTTWQLPILLKPAGILGLDPHRFRPFLGQPGIVEDQHPARRRVDAPQAPDPPLLHPLTTPPPFAPHPLQPPRPPPVHP